MRARRLIPEGECRTADRVCDFWTFTLRAFVSPQTCVCVCVCVCVCFAMPLAILAAAPAIGVVVYPGEGVAQRRRCPPTTSVLLAGGRALHSYHNNEPKQVPVLSRADPTASSIQFRPLHRLAVTNSTQACCRVAPRWPQLWRRISAMAATRWSMSAWRCRPLLLARAPPPSSCVSCCSTRAGTGTSTLQLRSRRRCLAYTLWPALAYFITLGLSYHPRITSVSACTTRL